VQSLLMTHHLVRRVLVRAVAPGVTSAHDPRTLKLSAGSCGPPVAKRGEGEQKGCQKYAYADQYGEVPRTRKGLTSDEYARALWRDGIANRWF
jgi:hypothetical protein